MAAKSPSDRLVMRAGTLAKARALAALARLGEMAADLPPVDAVAVTAEARRELDEMTR